MEKIIEGNKKIMVFMGCTKKTEADEEYWKIAPGQVGFISKFYQTHIFHQDEIAYHRSWDWLLPAWVKWWDEANKLVFNNPSLYERVRDVRIIFMACIDTGDISNAQRILADAITWYNQTSPSK